MKILNANELPLQTDCSCGAIIVFTRTEIRHGGDKFRHEYEEYIFCPNCGRKIILRSGSHCATPYD